MKKVSVIIPCYGVEKYLDRCVESIVGQSLKNIEIILVDDESPDNVPEMCDSWVALSKAKKSVNPDYPDIKVVHKKNGGLGYARNSGLDVASGEYVAFVDSDDFVDVGMYETLYNKAKSENADVVYCNCSVYKDDQNITPRVDVESEISFAGREEVDAFLLDMVAPDPSYPHDVKYMMSVWHSIYRREVLEKNKIRFVSERELISEDLIFDLDLLPHCTKVVYLPNCFYFYCENGSSLSRTVNPAKYQRIKTFEEAVWKRLECLFPEKKFENHFYRLQFLHMRNLMASTLEKSFQHSLREILSDPFWENLLQKYPYAEMDLKHRIFFGLCRKKSSILLCILLHLM